MSGRYATGTEVPVGRTRGEIEDLLVRYGATKFIYASETGQAIIGFELAGRSVRIRLPLPDEEVKR